MAVTNVGIYPNTENALTGRYLSIKSGDSAPALEFRFKTSSNSWVEANIWITVDIVRNGGNESINGYANIGADGALGVARTSFSTPTSVDGGYVYKMPLTNALMDDVETLLGTLTYSSRSYDAIRLKVEVNVRWGTSWSQAEKSSQTCFIGFKPAYTATGAQYDPSGLTITYSASGWGRPNDQYQTNAITSASKATVGAGVKGRAVSSSKLVIPKAKLKRIPSTGDTLSGSLLMRGSWQDDDSNLGTMSLAGVSVTNLTQVRVPSITATAQSDGVKVTVGAGTGTGTAAASIEVSMVGSTYSMDRVTLAPGDSYVFEAVPSGVSTTWQAIGINTVGGVEYASGPATATATAVNIDGAVITKASGGSVAIPYNATVSSSSKPEAETVKLAGRDRPTVGFGEGGSQTWDVSGVIVIDPAYTGTLVITDEEDVMALPFAGLCMLRFKDGRRAQVYVTDASVRRDHGSLRSVSIACEEVA